MDDDNYLIRGSFWKRNNVL